MHFYFDFQKFYCLIMLIEHLKVMQLKIWITNCWVHLTNKCQIGIKVMQLHGIKEREHIRCKPTFPCKLWKLQSVPSDQHPRGGAQEGGRGDLQKCDYPIQGRVVNCKITQSHMLSGCWSGGSDWSLHDLHGEVLYLIYSPPKIVSITVVERHSRVLLNCRVQYVVL